MSCTKGKLYYHEQLRALGEALAETLELDTSEEYSSPTEDQDTVQLYHDTVQQIGSHFEKARKIEQAKEAAGSKPAHGDYDVFLGVPKTPYHDNDCDCEVILHERGREENRCRTFYTVNVGIDETGVKNVNEKQQRPAFDMDGEDHLQKCDRMTQKLWVGFMRADAYDTFVDIYNSIEERESRAFACKLLTRCARERILPVTVGARAIKRALGMLDELAEITSADSSRATSRASTVPGA